LLPFCQNNQSRYSLSQHSSDDLRTDVLYQVTHHTMFTVPIVPDFKEHKNNKIRFAVNNSGQSRSAHSWSQLA